MIKFITDREIYEEVILNKISHAKNFIWLGTADIKDFYVKQGLTMVPFLKILSMLIDKGALIRLIHAKAPGTNFQHDFDKYPNLIDGLEKMLCPRIHFKCIIIDGDFAYSGSANLTGAGVGAKSKNKRNFESGFITDEAHLISQISEQFDNLWMGTFCKDCKRKEFCTDKII